MATTSLGFSPDPVLSAIAVGESIQGIQSVGVMACTKHYILNEQEHFRQGGEYGFIITMQPWLTIDLGTGLSDAISSNIDDVTLHELYLWPFAEAVKAGTASVRYHGQRDLTHGLTGTDHVFIQPDQQQLCLSECADA